jgi:hypothetical protein
MKFIMEFYSLDKTIFGMDELKTCVNELLNNHGQWSSKKSPKQLLMENQELYSFYWLFGPRIYAGFE